MKNLAIAAAVAAFAGLASAEELSTTVNLPAQLDTSAELEEARSLILTAAEEICDEVDYVGIAAFYRARMQRECVQDAFTNAVAAEPTGRLLAYLGGELETAFDVASN